MAFCECRNLREVVFEKRSRLKKIGQSAFQNCSRLRSISLPEGLESIGRYCFYESCLEEIAIPSGVTELEDHAFSDCKSLKKVTF